LARGEPPSAGRATGAERPPPRLRTLEESLRADRQDGAGGSGRRRGIAVAGGLASPARSSARNPSVPRTGQCFRHQSARDVKNPISPFRSVKNTGGSCLKIAFKSCPPSTRFAHRRAYLHISLFQWPKSINSAQIPSKERIGYPPEIAKRQKLRRPQWRHPSVLLPADQRVVTHFDAAPEAWRYDC